MITLVEALNFRSLRHVRQPLGRFHVLVGPNATGKTTFLDVPAFLGRLVSDGLEAALTDRTQIRTSRTWCGSDRGRASNSPLKISQHLRSTAASCIDWPRNLSKPLPGQHGNSRFLDSYREALAQRRR